MRPGKTPTYISARGTFSAGSLQFSGSFCLGQFVGTGFFIYWNWWVGHKIEIETNEDLTSVDLRQNYWRRKTAAILCLLAVVLLQAPFARAAWMSSSMACCMGDRCTIPAHHHKGHTQQTRQNDMPMDCDHEMGKMADCKMSSCKSSNETDIDVAPFVMPDFQMTLEPLAATSGVMDFALQMISRSEKPQSPPPKSVQS